MAKHEGRGYAGWMMSTWSVSRPAEPLWWWPLERGRLSPEGSSGDQFGQDPRSAQRVGETRRCRWAPNPDGFGLFRRLDLRGRPKGAIVHVELGGSGSRLRLNLSARDQLVAPAELAAELRLVGCAEWSPSLEESSVEKLLGDARLPRTQRSFAADELLIASTGLPVCGGRAQPPIRLLLRSLEANGLLCVRSVTASGARAFLTLSAGADLDAIVALLDAMAISLQRARVGVPTRTLVGPERYVVGFDQMWEQLRTPPGGGLREPEDYPGFVAHPGGLVAVEIGAADPSNVRFSRNSVLNQPVTVEDYWEGVHCNPDQVSGYVNHATAIASMLTSKTYNIPPVKVQNLSLPGNDDPSKRYGGFGASPTDGTIRVLSLDAIAKTLDDRCRESHTVWGFELTTEVWNEALHMSERWSGGGETQTARVLSVSIGSLLSGPVGLHGVYDAVGGDNTTGEDGATRSSFLCSLTDEFCFHTGVVVVAAIDNTENSNNTGALAPAACANVVAVGAYRHSEFGLVGVQEGVPANVHAIESESLQIVSLFKPEVLGPYTARALRMRDEWDVSSGNSLTARNHDGARLVADEQSEWAWGTSIAAPIVAAGAKWIDSMLAPCGMAPELVRAVLFCCCRGYAGESDLVFEQDFNNSRTAVWTKNFWRTTGGPRDAVFGVLRFELIGKFFAQMERAASPLAWSSADADAFCAGYALFSTGADSGRAFGEDVETQIQTEHGVQSVSVGAQQEMRFDDTQYSRWERVGIVRLPEIRKGQWHTLVATWSVPVDTSALSAEERETVQQNSEANEFVASYSRLSFDLGRIASAPLALRLVISLDNSSKTSAASVAAPDEERFSGSQSKGLVLNSFISGAPYRAFRFRSPFEMASGSLVQAQLELFWPIGVPRYNIPLKLAVALRGADGDAEDPEIQEGGLRLERDVVHAYQIFTGSDHVPVEINYDYAALRPAWRKHEV